MTNEYINAHRRYEEARVRYAALQQEIREFLDRFTGEAAAHEAEFVIRDLARMEMLRGDRDAAFDVFRAAEAEVFRRLAEPWYEHGDDAPRRD